MNHILPCRECDGAAFEGFLRYRLLLGADAMPPTIFCINMIKLVSANLNPDHSEVFDFFFGER